MFFLAGISRILSPRRYQDRVPSAGWDRQRGFEPRFGITFQTSISKPPVVQGSTGWPYGHLSRAFIIPSSIPGLSHFRSHDTHESGTEIGIVSRLGFSLRDPVPPSTLGLGGTVISMKCSVYDESPRPTCQITAKFRTAPTHPACAKYYRGSSIQTSDETTLSRRQSPGRAHRPTSNKDEGSTRARRQGLSTSLLRPPAAGPPTGPPGTRHFHPLPQPQRSRCSRGRFLPSRESPDRRVLATPTLSSGGRPCPDRTSTQLEARAQRAGGVGTENNEGRQDSTESSLAKLGPDPRHLEALRQWGPRGAQVDAARHQER